MTAGERRAAYAGGVIAAAAAFMEDLQNRGLLDDAEVLDLNEEGNPSVCTGCQMRRMGYPGLADRFEFAISVSSGGAE